MKFFDELKQQVAEQREQARQQGKWGYRPSSPPPPPTTLTVTYRNRKDLERGIKEMQKKGWQAASITPIDRGRSLAKTGALAAGLALVVAPITAPAALLGGKKSQGYIVIYKKE
jgi:hypothetical protein